jgi:hypothetical protein
MLFIEIQADGTLVEHNVEGETYSTLSKAVGGMIEPHNYSENLTHYHNEEFLYAEGCDDLNLAAFILSGQYLFFGPVIYTGGIDDEGETAGLSPQQAENLRGLAQAVRENLDNLRAQTAHITKPEPSFSITTW